MPKTLFHFRLYFQGKTCALSGVSSGLIFQSVFQSRIWMAGYVEFLSSLVSTVLPNFARFTIAFTTLPKHMACDDDNFLPKLPRQS